MTNIMLSGANGKMGRVIARLIGEDPTLSVSCGVDINEKPYADFSIYPSPFEATEDVDVIIDFSNPKAFDGIVDYAVKTKTPAVIATTGLSGEQIKRLEEASTKTAIFFSANMSLGVNLLIELVKKATKVLQDGFDIEIIEKHHNRKLDAPSGTALTIADAIKSSLSEEAQFCYGRHGANQKRKPDEIGIHAVRGGTIVGEHDVIFAGNDEIIEIRHTAQSREIFAVGAIKAAKFLADKKDGMYSMKNII